MWCLKEQGSGKSESVFVVYGTYTLGRSLGLDLTVEEASVSRLHAHVVLEQTGLYFEDKSKFGSKINGEKVAPGSRTALKAGDKVMVGIARTLEVSFRNLAICVSPKSDPLVQRLVDGGVKVVSEANLCSHLIVSPVRITSKLLTALMRGAWIVDPSWAEALLTRSSASSPLPDEKSHISRLISANNSQTEFNLEPNTQRLTLFEGHVVYFCAVETWQRYANLVRLGGGVSVGPEEAAPSSANALVELFVMPAKENLSKNSLVRRNLAELQTRMLPFLPNGESLAEAVLEAKFYVEPISKIQSQSLSQSLEPMPPPKPKRQRIEITPKKISTKSEPPTPQIPACGNGRTNVKVFRKQRVAGGGEVMRVRDMKEARTGRGGWAKEVLEQVKAEEEEEAVSSQVWDTAGGGVVGGRTTTKRKKK